jgi:hypothetical protein
MVVLLIVLVCLLISIPLGIHMSELYGDGDPFINIKKDKI